MYPHKLHLTRRLSCAVVIASTISLLLSPTGVKAAYPAEAVQTAINQARANQGLKPLKRSNTLEQAAKRKSADMFASDYFGHVSPSGRTFFSFVDRRGLTVSRLAEVLAVDYLSANEAVSAWLRSPTHQALVLNKNMADIGVSVRQGRLNGQSSIVIVVLLGTIAR